jgi:hypothetical protein
MKAVATAMAELQVGIPMRFHKTFARGPSLDRENRVLHAYSLGMAGLRKKSPWSGVLDSRTYLEGFVAGVEAADRSLDIDNCETSLDS